VASCGPAPDDAPASLPAKEPAITTRQPDPPVPDAPERPVRPRRPRRQYEEPRQSLLWPIATVVSLLFAVAGWTAVVVLVLTRPAGVAVATPTPGANQPAASVGDTTSHDAPDLEALLPTSYAETPLTTTSWLGGTILSGDDWSNSITAFLAGRELTPDDLKIAQAYDPNGALDLAAVAFEAPNVDPAAFVQAIIDAWKVDYPGLATTTVTIGDKTVIKGLFPEEPIASYWYAGSGVAYEVDSSNESIAAGVLATLH
jgi:hypothetical protein